MDVVYQFQGIEFEWNPNKAALNLMNHKVTFGEAATVLSDSLSITVSDTDHSFDEERFITVGWSNRLRLLLVAHTERGVKIRIISARQLTRTEREKYEQGNLI